MNMCWISYGLGVLTPFAVYGIYLFCKWLLPLSCMAGE